MRHHARTACKIPLRATVPAHGFDGRSVLGAAAAPSPVLIANVGEGAYPLAGPWRFHPGDDASWALPSFDDSRWEQLSGDRPWGVQGHQRYSGWAWYRLSMAFPATTAATTVSLLFERVNDVLVTRARVRESAPTSQRKSSEKSM